MLLWWERPATPHRIARQLRRSHRTDRHDEPHRRAARPRTSHKPPTALCTRFGYTDKAACVIFSFRVVSRVALWRMKPKLHNYASCLPKLALYPTALLCWIRFRAIHAKTRFFHPKILQNKFPNQKYLLVTSAFHMRRSEGCFQESWGQFHAIFNGYSCRSAPFYA